MMRLSTCLIAMACLGGASRGESLVYDYSFRLPVLVGENYTRYTFFYSKGPIAVNPATGDLIVRGHAQFNDFAVVKVPPKPASGIAVAVIEPLWFDPSFGAVAAAGRQNFIQSLTMTSQGTFLNAIQPWYNVLLENTFPFVLADPVSGMYAGPWNAGQHSLSLGNYVCQLSPELKAAFKCEFAGGGTIPQGVSASNWGPSLYTFNTPAPATPALSTFQSTPLLTYPREATYRKWWPSSEVNSITCTKHSVLWFGRVGYSPLQNILPNGSHTPAAWYGESTVVFRSRSGAKVTVTDEASNAKGYHSDKYRRTAFWCSNRSLIDGNPVIVEQELSFCSGRTCEICGVYDPMTERVYILDAVADQSNHARGQPLIHVCRLKE